MSDEDFGLEFDFDEDDVETIVIENEDGTSQEFYVMDEIEHKGNKFLLVIEAEQVEDDEADALIFKEVSSNETDIIYEELSDEEFSEISEIISGRFDDYDVSL